MIWMMGAVGGRWPQISMPEIQEKIGAGWVNKKAKAGGQRKEIEWKSYTIGSAVRSRGNPLPLKK